MTYELGYTPKNLRKILSENDLSQKDAYTYLGKARSTFGRYLLDADNKSHVPMSHKDWLKLLEIAPPKGLQNLELPESH